MTHPRTLPSVLLFLAPAAAVQDEKGKEPPRFPLRLEYGKGFGWTSKTHAIREEDSNNKQKFEATIGGEAHKQENSFDLLQREELDSLVRMEFLEAEEGEVRRARFTIEEQRYRRRVERDGEVQEKDDAPKSSEIEGCEIAFRWGEEENQVELKGGSLGKEEREGFVEGQKYRDLNPLAAYFLPKEPVAVGETWILEGRALRQILNHTLEDSQDDVRARKALSKELRLQVELAGELRAKLEEVVEKEGRRTAVVSIAGKPKEEGSTESKEGESTWKTAFEVSGTLRFGVDLGLPESLEFSVAAKTTSSQSGEHEGEKGEGGFSFSRQSTLNVRREFRTECVPLREPEEEPARKKEGEEKKGG
ncbi:MAG TPA: hypothetical protein VFI25_20070 [Planctomycetota bacterium]|jgi:hypothetical protein|nr:hypothetical protein [Planctomycetota bacterium]